MKIISKILIITMLLVLIVPTLSFATEPKNSAYDSGTTWGEIEGSVEGYKDFLARNDPNPEAAYTSKYSSNSSVIMKFKISSFSDEYKASFISGHKDAFIEAYTKSYTVQDAMTDTEAGNTHGSYNLP